MAIRFGSLVSMEAGLLVTGHSRGGQEREGAFHTVGKEPGSPQNRPIGTLSIVRLTARDIPEFAPEAWNGRPRP